MDAQLENFNKFKNNLNYTYSFCEPDETFIDFLLNIYDVFKKLKNEIRSYSLNLEPEVYSKFKKIVNTELEGINSYKAYKDIKTIKPWIEKYSFYYNGIESILQIVNYPEFYKEEGCPRIYNDLGYTILCVPDQYLDELHSLQDDFLKFTKANLIEDIINLINKDIDSNGLNNKEDITIDLSDSKGTEKIIMLVELGVLDFLRDKKPFKTSTNRLASAISGITGMNAGTVQSYINPILSQNVIQDNNPLLSEKALNKVYIKLIKIGYNQAE